MNARSQSTNYFTALVPTLARIAGEKRIQSMGRVTSESELSHMITVRHLIASDFSLWWALRKRALEFHPDAFGSTLANAIATSDVDARTRFVDVSISSDNAIFAAFNDANVLVGNAGLFRETGTKEGHRAGIWGVYVDPVARGQRIGDKLLNAAVSYARSQPGILQLELTVACHNGPALALYQRAGFQIFGRHPRGLILDGVPIDEFLMVLILDEPGYDAGIGYYGEVHDDHNATNP